MRIENENRQIFEVQLATTRKVPRFASEALDDILTAEQLADTLNDL